jgi:EmrB/QacA subfamily drug resistance transporter
MVILDVSIVNVALPAIRNSLGFSASNLQWILNAYTLAFAGLLLLGGRLADIFGRRKIFLLGLAIFTLASLTGALSNSQGVLIASRALQGLGGAILSPSTLTIITTTFEEGRARAKALGMWSAVAGAGGAAGALLGGVLTDLLSWRWIFLINIPIGIVAVVGTLIYLSERKSVGPKKSLDIVGSILVTLGVTSLVFGLVSGGEVGWSSLQTLGSFVLSVILVVLFVLYEARGASSPIVPLGLFRLRSLSVSNAAMFFVGGAVFASWYFLSLYMQEVLGYSPLKAGLAFVPQTLAIIAGAQISSRLVIRIGARPILIVAPLISALGLVLLHGISPTSSYLGTLALPSILVTLGVGLSFTPLAIAATGGVPREQAGLASGLLNTSRQVGGAIGLAGLSAIALARSNAFLASQRALGHLATHSVIDRSLSSGYGQALEVSAFIALAACVMALLLPRSRRDGPSSRGGEDLDESILAVEGI